MEPMQDECGFDSVVVFVIPKVLGLKPRHIAVVIIIRWCWDIDDGAAAIMTAPLGLAHTAAATKGKDRGSIDIDEGGHCFG